MRTEGSPLVVVVVVHHDGRGGGCACRRSARSTKRQERRPPLHLRCPKRTHLGARGERAVLHVRGVVGCCEGEIGAHGDAVMWCGVVDVKQQVGKWPCAFDLEGGAEKG